MRRVVLVASAALALVALAGAADALAQAAGPFGVGRPDGPGGAPAAGGLLGWIAAQQSSFYRSLSAAIRAAKTDNAALFSLAGLSFAYGVFHAAGPGHGKAVISSYLIATGEGFRRGVALSTLAALAQAVTAIAAVGLIAVVLGATSMAMGVATWWLEAASYAVILTLGLVLVWRKGRGFLRTLRGQAAHVHGPDCAHEHGVDPKLVEGRVDWRRAGAAVLAIGLRPCTGALVVLVFALAQGILWAGVAATFAMAAGTAVTVAAIAALAVGAKGLALRLAAARPGAGSVALAGLETLAALVVLAFGAIMLAGLLLTGVGAPG
ncbi:ABC-type nickel/cobalt efflux system permease component RcnA [Methylopila capsulata]|uniref:Nickel/cobalt efflux system n=1 Tax=Methylopila capsulata TaxID=61654 RepID=A0A9W6IV04_9HYPH|nr:nickel/cobalt transporter [Methylopila capsulata]MBM7852824.1 ABC-type nickel/cobalt efflux system permease component RcnA [Methylopila capsulata]GLK57033.1 nickel/cobalt efflux system [Methylopila capsulata]